MTTLHPHINFNGNAEEAFTFYKSVFGGEFGRITRFKDIESEEFQVPGDEREKLMHIELMISPTSMLMGNDVPSFMGKTNEQENRSKIVVRVASKEEAEKLFAGLSVGAEVEMPLSDNGTGGLFSMFRDKYGIEWIIEYAQK
ncbi:MAG: hypothetical protein RI911_174 [Candidatus Parcubacteria bacterium]|jgi:PhnB protein